LYKINTGKRATFGTVFRQILGLFSDRVVYAVIFLFLESLPKGILKICGFATNGLARLRNWRICYCRMNQKVSGFFNL
jgi:hypothetical protein